MIKIIRKLSPQLVCKLLTKSLPSRTAYCWKHVFAASRKGTKGRNVNDLRLKLLSFPRRDPRLPYRIVTPQAAFQPCIAKGAVSPKQLVQTQITHIYIFVSNHSRHMSRVSVIYFMHMRKV